MFSAIDILKTLTTEDTEVHRGILSSRNLLSSFIFLTYVTT